MRRPAIKHIFARGPLLGLRLIIFLSLALALMILDGRYARLSRVRASLSLLVAPIEYTVNLPFSFATWLSSSLTSHQKLNTENTYLRAQHLLLQAQVQKFRALEKENEQLRALLQSAPKDSDKVLVAQLMAVDANPFVQEFVLDKGSHDGVYVGQPVLDAHGIMGQVTAVEPLTSRVMLITDSRSAVPVQVIRNGLRTTVVGNGGNDDLSLLHITQTADVQRGDVLVSSGLGRRFPLGYPVGTVHSVKHDPGQRFMTIYVQPSAELNRSRQILLVWPAENVVNSQENTHA